MILEALLFSLLFCVIWFFIFRIKLLKDKKKILENAKEKIRKQDKTFIYDGKEIDLNKEIDLAEQPLPIPKPKNSIKKIKQDKPKVSKKIKKK